MKVSTIVKLLSETPSMQFVDIFGLRCEVMNGSEFINDHFDENGINKFNDVTTKMYGEDLRKDTKYLCVECSIYKNEWFEFIDDDYVSSYKDKYRYYHFYKIDEKIYIDNIIKAKNEILEPVFC